MVGHARRRLRPPGLATGESAGLGSIPTAPLGRIPARGRSRGGGSPVGAEDAGEPWASAGRPGLGWPSDALASGDGREAAPPGPPGYFAGDSKMKVTPTKRALQKADDLLAMARATIRACLATRDPYDPRKVHWAAMAADIREAADMLLSQGDRDE